MQVKLIILIASNIREMVQNQLLNNLKLLNKIKKLNELEKKKEVMNVKRDLISELKHEVEDRSLHWSRQKMKRITRADIQKLKKKYYQHKKPFQPALKLETNYEKW